MEAYKRSADEMFDSYHELMRFNPRKWDPRCTSAVLAVKFPSSSKIYRYYTHMINLHAGYTLDIMSLGKPAAVTVIGYCNLPGLAGKMIDIININKNFNRSSTDTPLGRKQTMREAYLKHQSELQEQLVYEAAGTFDFPEPKGSHVRGTRPTHIIIDDIEETLKGESTIMKVTSSLKATVKKSAKLGYKIQKGNAGLSAVHATIQNAAPVPESIKILAEEYKDYINLVLGLGAETLANAFADSEIIRDFADSVNTAATAKLAVDITTVQSIIENVITNVLTPKADDSDPGPTPTID